MIQPRRIARFGWRPDSLDHRDKLYHLRPTDTPLTHLVDLRSGLPDSYDQGQLGECVGNGTAGVMQYARRKAGLPDFTPSRLYIYYYARLIEGTVGQDAGAEIRDGIKVVATRGAPDETLWPNDISKFTMEPDAVADSDALADLAVAYESIDNTDIGALKNCLAVVGNPIVFGCSVYQQFENVGVDGIVTMPGSDDAPIGGHCMVIVGYDDSRSDFLVRNSWGPSLGMGGHCWMPYTYLTNASLADDFWHVSLVSAI